MRKIDGSASRSEVLVFQRGIHSFGIDTDAVSFVHDSALLGTEVPQFDLATLSTEAPTDDGVRVIRIAHGTDVFDLRAGSRLRVQALDRDSLRAIPEWLAGLAARAALLEMSFTADRVIWLLDVAALARRAQTQVAG